MLTTQKIKKLIILISVMLILALTCVFKSFLHPFFVNSLANRFKLVTNKNNLLVHFINVGQADATAINFPNGKTMLIDCGSKVVNTTYVNYIKENVLNTKSDNYIDYLVLSHADMDHVGGTLKLLKEFKLGIVYLPKISSDTDSYIEIKNYIENNCDYVYLGDEFAITGPCYEIIFYEILFDNSTNSSSQVIKVNGFNNSFLFLGDVSKEEEIAYIERYKEELDCDVLKIAHHGSNTSTSTELLDVATPKYAVISVGNNDYGHPTQQVLNNLTDRQIQVLRTDVNNNILFSSGEVYDLLLLEDEYYITRLSLDYTMLVLVINGVLIICSIVIIVKKERNKHLSS